ncbi:MAG: hypothetical protein P8176_07660, partial [Gammaproteobacteria bacterium]
LLCQRRILIFLCFHVVIRVHMQTLSVIADRLIDMGKRMRSIRLTASFVNAVQTVVNFIPFVGPAISSLGELAQNVSATARAHDLLVGLHELKTELGQTVTEQPEIQGVTMSKILPETQNTPFGELKLSEVLENMHENYIYQQMKQLEKALGKQLPEEVDVPEKPQLTVNAQHMQDQQNNAAEYSSATSMSQLSAEEVIPDADPQLAVTHEDIQTPQSAQAHDTASVASSGLKTEDERDCQNILMSAVKRNLDLNRFASFIDKSSYKERLHRTVTNKKGVESSAFDFAAHYGRPDHAELLMDKDVVSASNRLPLEVLEDAAVNKGHYDNKGKKLS